MCQFSLPIHGDAESLIQRAQNQITRTGGAFSGDATQGNFKAKTPIGAVEGSYHVIENEITLAITKKPFLLSCKKIENELRGVMV